jgi:hypothetical protein
MNTPIGEESDRCNASQVGLTCANLSARRNRAAGSQNCPRYSVTAAPISVPKLLALQRQLMDYSQISGGGTKPW